MDRKTIFLFLALVKILQAKPGPQFFVTPCEVWSFNGQYVKDYDKLLQTDIFNYTCVEEKRCNRFKFQAKPLGSQENDIIEIRTVKFNLTEDAVTADASICPNNRDVCCPGRFVEPIKPVKPIKAIETALEPKKDRSIEKNWPDVGNCGLHNPSGLPRKDGVVEKIPGISTQEGEWPHVCIILHNKDNLPLPTIIMNEETIIGEASLIAPKVLLTAAHLLHSKDGNPLSADNIKIRCGEYDLKLGEIDQYDYQDRNVDTFTIHPFFSGMETLRNDIALIHTKESFKQAPNVNRICLPVTDVSFSKENCSTMGWKTHPEKTDNNTSRVLKQVQITRETDREKCEKSVRDRKKANGNGNLNWKLDRSWECAEAAKKEKFLCKEQLGAPLVCAEELGRYVLAGIMAFAEDYGIGCGQEKSVYWVPGYVPRYVPYIYTSVQKALCFIDYDVKCKHGKEFIHFFDYDTECRTWFEDQIPAHAWQGREQKNLKSLSKTCIQTRDK